MEIPSAKCFTMRSVFMLCSLCFCFAFICALYSLSSPSKQPLVSQGFRYLSTGAVPGVAFATSHLARRMGSPTVQPSSSAVTKPFSNKQMRHILTSHPSSAACRNATLSPTKLILLWTPFFGYWSYFPQGPYKHCTPCSNCQVTTDRERLAESDAVVFHARDLSMIDLPSLRSPRQVWVFYCLESPSYSNFPGLAFMHSMFNWTMTYRSDSEVYTPYGKVEKVSTKQPIDDVTNFNLWKGKSKSVVWISSHCPTASARDDYVEQLGKYIDIDVYGSCGNLSCSKSQTEECLRNFEKKYKFFLAFENSICKDYVTEKFFRVLQYNMVPVVFGGSKYEQHAPPGSYINALSFQSPKHLAYYLTKVGSVFSLYGAYFEWKGDHVIDLRSTKECALCNRLHSNKQATSVYKDLRKWWIDDANCRSWTDDLR